MTDLTGAIVLGDNQYGKAENRIVRIYRDTPRHEIRDVSVSTCLRGDFSAAHLAGDQSSVLPTDTQKQTAYSYAKEKGLDSIEEYGLTLARHFVDDVAPVRGARIEIEEYAWQRAVVDGAEHDLIFGRARGHQKAVRRQRVSAGDELVALRRDASGLLPLGVDDEDAGLAILRLAPDEDPPAVAEPARPSDGLEESLAHGPGRAAQLPDRVLPRKPDRVGRHEDRSDPRGAGPLTATSRRSAPRRPSRPRC